MPETNKNENREGIKTFYSPEPHPNGYFDRFGLNESPAGAVLELKLDNSNKTGTFSLINNPEIIKMIVNSDFANIGERVLIKNYWKDINGNLRTNFKIIKEGVIRLEEKKWMIESPCEIEFLDYTDETPELPQEIGQENVVQAETEVLALDQQAENRAEVTAGEEAREELKDKLEPGEEEVAEVVAEVNQNENNPVTTTVKAGETIEWNIKTPKTNNEIEIEYQTTLRQNTIEGFQKFIDDNPTSTNLIADAQRNIDRLNNEIKKSADFEQTKARLLEIVEQAREEWAKLAKEKLKGNEGKANLENAKKDWDDAKREYVKFLLETDPTNGKVLAQEFLLSQVEFKKEVEKSGWDKLKEKVSKGIKWWENVGNNPKDKKITRIVKKTIKATINVAIIGGAGAIVVSGAAALGIGSAAAISGSIASYVGQRMLNSSIISAATAILPPGLQQIASITLSVTSVAGATGLLVSKGVGLATKKLYSEEAIAKSTKEKKSNLENQIEVGLDEAKLAQIEEEIEKILKAEKNKRLARRVLAGASALATSVAVLEMSAPLTNPENTENNNLPEDRLSKSPYAQQISQDTSNQEIENINEDGNLNKSEEIDEERTQNQNEETEQTKFTTEENVKHGEGVTQTLKHLYEKESNQDNIPEWFKNGMREDYAKKDWAEFAEKIGVYDAEAKLDSLVVHEGDKIGFDANENLILERNGESFVLAKPDDSGDFVKGDWQTEMQNEKFMDTDKYPNTGSTIERIGGDEIIEPGRIEKLGYIDEDDKNYQGEGHQYPDQEGREIDDYYNQENIDTQKTGSGDINNRIETTKENPYDLSAENLQSIHTKHEENMVTIFGKELPSTNIYFLSQMLNQQASEVIDMETKDLNLQGQRLVDYIEKLEKLTGLHPIEKVLLDPNSGETVTEYSERCLQKLASEGRWKEMEYYPYDDELYKPETTPTKTSSPGIGGYQTKNGGYTTNEGYSSTSGGYTLE